MAMYVMIPSGQRAPLLQKTIEAWNRKGIQVVCYTWDRASWAISKRLSRKTFFGQRKSFAILHNFMIQTLPKDWTGVICGSDDLHPSRSRKYNRLSTLCEKHDGKILWVFDGINNKLNTHPIITRGWYKKNLVVFNECFSHHCCDSDLMLRARDDIIRVDGIAFDHRHPLKTAIEDRDEVYQIGHSTLHQDRRKLLEIHKRNDVDVVAANCKRSKI